MTPGELPDRHVLAAAVRELAPTPLRDLILASLERREPSAEEALTWAAAIVWAYCTETDSHGRPA